ncbi:CBM96 family carbohydrate-binding protein [Pyxidicoccus xibeiensis]|uniref:CBM96 family carbohydrate-binding protein n=1 Tax=Pyxidicoccus xibeiensis TaxID=2906759 RepID=UPI0020A70884|nr:DNRLRE domain-containing protein [Pyxidicoccus xibeiensis]MCP3140338.1 DNRLRE domain-containing protein [Pyxidicoccus xibeiensis]
MALVTLVGCGAPQGEEESSTGGNDGRATQRAALTTQTVTLSASADAHVVATAPTTSYGSSPTLEVDLAPESEAYLKFSVPDLEGTVTSARLRLYAVDGSANGPTVYDPPGVRDFNEQVTWNTRPQDCCSSWSIASVGAVASGTWMEFDVSNAYFHEGSSFRVFLGADSTDGVTLASSEHPDVSLRPQLILTFESAADHPMPRPPPFAPASAPVAFAPSADTYVSEASPGSASGGSSTTLLVDGSPQQEAHLRFTVQGLGETVQRAVLRLHATAGTDDGPAVYATQGSWSESGATWSSRPTKVGAALADSQAIAAGAYMDYDVTDVVRGNGDYGFGVSATSTDGVTFHSREAADATRRPQLLVWTGAPRAAPTDACLTRTEVFSRETPPTQDTYVGEDSPDMKFQHQAALRVDSEPRAESFLDFDVNLDAGRVRRVLLRMYAVDATGNGPRLFRAAPFEAASTDWNHRPAVTGAAIGDLGAVGRDTWVEYDVTGVVTASGRYTFALHPDSTDGARFVSTESEARGILSGAPRLVVVYESDAFCSYRGTKPSGTTVWAHQAGGPLAEHSVHVAPAPNGGFAALSTVEPAPDASPRSDPTDVVTLHRADGSVAWTRSFTQPGVSLSKVVVTAVGNVLVAGSYEGTPDLGKGALPRGRGIVVMKLTPSGSVDWTRGFTAWYQLPDEYLDNPMTVLDLTTDAHGSALLVGTFWGYTDFGNGPVYSGKAFPYDDTYPNSFVLKLQWDGAHLWSRVLVADTLRGTRASSVAVDAAENVIVGGWAGRNTDFGGGTVADWGPFVAKYSVGGAYAWHRLLPVLWSSLAGLDVLPDGRVAFAGSFGGRFTFAGQTYASSEPDEYEGGPYDGMVGLLGADGADLALRQFAFHSFHDLVVDAAGNLVTSQWGEGGGFGLGEVGWEHGEWGRPTLAAFGTDLSTRWVRVFDPLDSTLQLAPVGDGLVVSGHSSQPFELEGTWYMPISRRSDVLRFKLRP